MLELRDVRAQTEHGRGGSTYQVNEGMREEMREGRKDKPIQKGVNLGWSLLTLSATVIGIFSLRYGLPHVPYPAHLPNFTINHAALIVHAVSASLALLFGPWQFLSHVRVRYPRFHRYLGRAYALVLGVAAASAIWIAPHAAGGYVSTAGFLSLALGWAVTTSLGIINIRSHRVAAHRRWMIRSFALTAAAITLRLYLPSIPLLHLNFNTAYPAISWLCWVPNLLLAEFWIRRDSIGKLSNPVY